MSSMLSRWSQIPARERYFTVLDGSSSQWDFAPLATSNITIVSSVLSSFDFVTNTTPLSYLPIGTFLKDMGRTFSVYDSSQNSVQIAVFRQVQIVSNVNTEGATSVSTNNPFICVWSANESGILTELNGFQNEATSRRAMVLRTG